jgi:hypothetical protein
MFCAAYWARAAEGAWREARVGREVYFVPIVGAGVRTPYLALNSPVLLPGYNTSASRRTHYP